MEQKRITLTNKEFYEQKHILNEYVHKSVRIINRGNGLPTVSNSNIHIIGKLGEVLNTTSSKTIDILLEDNRNDFVTDLLAK